MPNRAVVLGYWALAAISLLWGSTWFVSKLAIAHLPALQMSGYRQMLAGMILIVYHVSRSRQWPGLKELGFHALLGILFFTCSNGLSTFAIQFIPSYLAALIGCLMPFAVILLNGIFFGERVKPGVLIALGIGFSGVALILSSFVTEISGGGSFLFGILITLLSVFTWSGGTLLSTRSRMNTDPFRGIGWQMLLGGIMLRLISLLVEKQVPLSSVPAVGWVSFAYLVLVGSLLCFICYLYAIKTLPLSLVSVYVYINPMVALGLGVLFLGEHITLRLVLGAVITLFGVYLVKRLNKGG